MSVDAISWVLNEVRGLKPAERLLLLVLADCVDADWTWAPSQKMLADRTELAKETVRVNAKRLEERGLLRREERTDKTGRTTSNRYVLTPQGRPCATGGATPLSDGGVTTFTPHKKQSLIACARDPGWSVDDYELPREIDESEDARAAVQRWLDDRKQRRLSKYASGGFVKRLLSRCGGDVEHFIDSIDFSIDMAYAGPHPSDKPKPKKRRDERSVSDLAEDEWTQ